MKLRFKINQAACLLQGIDAPKSIVTIEITPSNLSLDTRWVLARHLDGIDMCELDEGGEKQYHFQTEVKNARGDDQRPVLIEANEPTLDGLLDALKKNSPATVTTKAPHTKPQEKVLKKALSMIEGSNRLQHKYRTLRDKSKVPVIPFMESPPPKTRSIMVPVIREGG